MFQSHGILQSQKDYVLPTVSNSLSWNFGSGHIDLGASLNRPGDVPFSVCWWAKMQQPTGNNGLWGNQASSSPFSGIACWTDTTHQNYLKFEIVRTGSSAIRARFFMNINAGEWHHFIMSYDGSKNINGVKCYMDGVQLNTINMQNNLTGTINTFGTSKIGTTELYGNMQNSSMDEFSTVDQDINEQEAAGIYNSGLISDMSVLGAVQGWWRADSDGGGIAYDEISGNNGVYDGTVNLSGDAP